MARLVRLTIDDEQEFLDLLSVPDDADLQALKDEFLAFRNGKRFYGDGWRFRDWLLQRPGFTRVEHEWFHAGD